jgi:type II restriction/modification system DNA methylase subunit YeeA
MLPLPKNPNSEIVNKISSIVENQLTLNEEIKIASLDTKKEQIKQKIEYNEDKINSLVYQLYNLTKEEIELLQSN